MIIDTAKLLGILFHQKKSKNELIEISSALSEDGVLREATVQSLFDIDEEALSSDFTELFEGLGEMKVPPWGSVYLDREKVVFGDSTVQYRQFLLDNEIALNTVVREPEDQFGLMLLAFAFLLESNKTQAAKVLMEEHLLVWGMFYLKLLNKASHNKFYSLLALDVYEWLNKIIDDLCLVVEEKKIYLND
ncbi:molecular chaperone TorD family protein [Vibrio paucivorans]|uniref:Molecular chaperone TorD family protein n=1 Tax=Vibrio paucivorans TaxID=2829489 RepID=A0A9X3HRM4_9VIBR|nr:molecular chaperone TorD family protein [Vibrio paucivorans]MCW8334093.1 molecular chaperone TorD family protein [Vibrio paucivorans]